jgi:predicted RNA-binding protein with PIN domain
VRWLVDGYNVIRRSPELSAREHESLEAGRRALCDLLRDLTRATGDQFTVVFDGARASGQASATGAVRVVFSSARESADRVLARLAREGGAVVSNDREVRRAASAAGAIAITTDEFLARVETLDGPADAKHEEDDDGPRPPRSGNPRRLGRKARARARALRRLGGPGRT